jgi:putative restriction endonuclease
VIRASHIKPWSKCDNQERLDPENGLPLVATLDALFDRGFITFDQEGKLIVSTELAVDEVELFGLKEGTLRKTPSEKTGEFLEFHRTHVFKE